jgi:hypothetical protein
MAKDRIERDELASKLSNAGRFVPVQTPKEEVIFLMGDAVPQTPWDLSLSFSRMDVFGFTANFIRAESLYVGRERSAHPGSRKARIPHQETPRRREEGFAHQVPMRL